ncbi:MAG: hypothetical protein M0003_04645, partial [Acidithiobacillus sp.]|nr:hypothetical protein [Acidithiobacillus sp.]
PEPIEAPTQASIRPCREPSRRSFPFMVRGFTDAIISPGMRVMETIQIFNIICIELTKQMRHWRFLNRLDSTTTPVRNR